MFAQLTLFPEEASTIAPKVDLFFAAMIGVTGAVALGIFLLLGYFVIRYRRRPDTPARTPRIMGMTWMEVLWSLIPLLIFIAMFIWGARLYVEMASPPGDAMEVYVVGKQWMWKMQHSEGQREINELHIPVGRPVVLTLTSEDVIHDFFVPAFRTKVDVLPGRYVHTWFQATKPGRYRITCAQYCGTSHAEMKGYVEVLEPADYDAWLSRRAEGSLALEGRKLFLKLQCASCHTADPHGRAPVLENLYGTQTRLRDGRTVTADEAYLRESMLDPAAKVVLGWEPVMPSYKNQVSEEDIIKVIAYLKSLKRGETPVRDEEAVQPVQPVVQPVVKPVVQPQPPRDSGTKPGGKP